MNYELPSDMKLNKKEEEQIEGKVKNFRKMGRWFCIGLLWPITTPILIYKKIRGKSFNGKRSKKKK